jgi:hypothetical protein
MNLADLIVFYFLALFLLIIYKRNQTVPAFHLSFFGKLFVHNLFITCSQVATCKHFESCKQNY